MKFWIDVAHHSISLKDPQTTIMVYTSLNINSLHRLAKTISKLPTKYIEKKNKIQELINTQSSYKNLRIFQKENKEIARYFGIQLKGLIFTLKFLYFWFYFNSLFSRFGFHS